MTGTVLLLRYARFECPGSFRSCVVDVSALRSRVRDVSSQLQLAAQRMLRDRLATVDMTG